MDQKHSLCLQKTELGSEHPHQHVTPAPGDTTFWPLRASIHESDNYTNTQTHTK